MLRPRTHQQRTRRLPASRNVIVVLTLALAVAGVGALSASAQGNEDKVTICHRTNSATNPYVQITVDESAVDGQGPGGGDHFGEHQGPLVTSEAEAQALKDQGQEWGDIIPPVPPFHGGLNWTPEGQAILANGCNFVTQPPPTQPPPTQPPPTQAAPPAAPPPPPGPAARPPAPQAPVQAPAAAAPVAGQPRTTG